MTNATPLNAARAVTQQAEMIQAEREASIARAIASASKMRLLEYRREVERGLVTLKAWRP